MRFSFSFQQETPVSLQIDEAEEFGKDQEVSRDEGSVSDFFRPWRQRTSSSAKEDRNELMKRSHKRVFIGGSVKMMYLSLSLSLGFFFPQRSSMAERTLIDCVTDEKRRQLYFFLCFV